MIAAFDYKKRSAFTKEPSLKQNNPELNRKRRRTAFSGPLQDDTAERTFAVRPRNAAAHLRD
jgi:hypothetical protein